MKDWQKQVDQMVAQWTDMQRNMWDQWVDSVRAFGQDSRSADALRADYEQQLARWEQTVQQALEAQRDWSEQWARSFGQTMPVAPGLSGLPGLDVDESTRQLTAHMQSVMNDWVASQQKLWETWLTSLQALDSGSSTERWEQERQRLAATWQEAAEQAQASMAAWLELMERVAPAVAEPAPEAAPKAAQADTPAGETPPAPAEPETAAKSDPVQEVPPADEKPAAAAKTPTRRGAATRRKSTGGPKAK